MIETKWSSVPATKLVRTLKNCGLDVPDGLPEEIVKRSAETLDLLCGLLTDPDLAEAEEGIWAGIHAMHLVGAVGENRAVPALIEAIRIDQAEEFLGDLLTEEVGNIIAHFPPEACGPLKELVLDTSLDVFHRFEPTHGLFGIACKHPECRDDIASFLIELIQEDEDLELVSFLVGELAKTDRPDAKAVIDQAWDRGRVDDIITFRGEFDFIRKHYKPWYDPRLDRDPMEHFSPKKLAHYKKVQESWENLENEPKAEPVITGQRRLVKIGRNQTCPCGSGKKYKWCCLGTANDPALRPLR